MEIKYCWLRYVIFITAIGWRVQPSQPLLSRHFSGNFLYLGFGILKFYVSGGFIMCDRFESVRMLDFPIFRFFSLTIIATCIDGLLLATPLYFRSIYKWKWIVCKMHPHISANVRTLKIQNLHNLILLVKRCDFLHIPATPSQKLDIIILQRPESKIT